MFENIANLASFLLVGDYKMPRGIYKRTEEHIRKLSQAASGRIHSEETKEKISKALKGITKEMNPNLIKSIRTREKMSKPKSEETKRNIREARRGKPSNSSGKHWSLSKKTKRRMKNAQSKKWQSPEYREKQLKAIFAGLKLRPTKPERRMRNGLNKMFPGEYRYVGDGQTFIGGKCPDFINVNGQKKIIELFGTFWHGEDYRRIAFNDNTSNKEHEQQRIKHFAKYGFKTLIIWENELKNIKKLKKKIRNFEDR